MTRAPRGRGTSLRRLLDLAVVMSKGERHTLGGLAAAAGVCERTIRRDLVLLSEAGFPVRNTADAHANGYNGYWWMDRHCPWCRRAA